MIKFFKNRPSISVTSGSNLMKGLRAHGVPVASSCGGVAVCAKCWVRVVDGAEHLSAPGSEEKALHLNHDRAADERLSCQAEVHGDVTLDTTYW